MPSGLHAPTQSHWSGRPESEWRTIEQALKAPALVTTRAAQAGGGFSIIRPNILSSEAIADRLHIFCQRYQTYCHSKAATFFNRQAGRYVATLGSANVNPRSLDDQRDSQDSEMNIWWSGRRPVMDFRARLWTHHLRLSDPLAADERVWAENGWNNRITSCRREAARSQATR